MATFDGLFDPAKVAEKRRLDSEKREALARIKAWAEELLPEPARGRLKVTVNEVVCGDPACAGGPHCDWGAAPDGASNVPWQRGHHTRCLSRTFHRVPHWEQTWITGPA